MKNARNYHRRATECLAFAKIARDEEERRQLLNMADILSRLAVEREKKTTVNHKPKIVIRGQPC